jgi:aspartate aminotransferase
VEENARRAATGQRFLFLLFDQVYGSLVYGGTHAHPVALVPESAPYVISLDGISKAFAATGLRVGWSYAAPAVTARMRDFLGHVGAWAPRPEQVAAAAFLRNTAAVEAFRARMDAGVRARLDALHQGFDALRAEGLPVDCVHPQGAIYLSLRMDLIGKTVGGAVVTTNEDIRRLLLEQAGIAVVPFQAFGLAEDTGWFRLSVGAVSLEDIARAFPRLRALLEQAR